MRKADGGLSSALATLITPLCQKLLELLPVGSDERTTWSNFVRVTSTVQTANSGLEAYLGTGTAPEDRVKLDNGTKLLGLTASKNGIESILKKGCGDLLTNFDTKTIINKIDETLKLDGPFHYAKARDIVGVSFDAIIDPKDDLKRTLRVVYGGASDGTVWSATLEENAGWDKTYKLASTTLLTLNPMPFTHLFQGS